MTPDQLSHAKTEREGVPATEEQTAALRDGAIRNVVAELGARADLLVRMMEQGRLSARPVDITPGIVGVLQAQSRLLMHLADEVLRVRGAEPALVFRVPPPSNGNGDGPKLVVES